MRELFPDNAKTLIDLDTTQMYQMQLQYLQDIAAYSTEFLLKFPGSVGLSLSSFLVESAYNVRSYKCAIQILKFMREKKVALTAEEVGQMSKIEVELKLRVAEQTSGIFDFKRLFRSVNGHPFPRIEVSDYRSPKIQVFERKNGERLFRTTCDVMPGDLLLVEKAVVYSNVRDYADALSDLQKQYDANVKPMDCGVSAYGVFEDANIKFISDIESNLVHVHNFQAQHKKFNMANMNESAGYGVFQSINLLRNSCEHNCSFSFLGDLLIVTALAPIEKNQPLVVNRFSPLNPITYKNAYELEQLDYCSCSVCKRLTTAERKTLALRHIAYTDKLRPLTDSDAVVKLVEKEEDFADRMAGIRFRQPLSGVYARTASKLFEIKSYFLAKVYCDRYLEAANYTGPGYLDYPGEETQAKSLHENHFFVMILLQNAMKNILDNHLDEANVAEHVYQIGKIDNYIETAGQRYFGWAECVWWRYE